MSAGAKRGGAEYSREAQHGDVPAPRFGHTTTLIGGTRVVLFGGATGDSGRYTIIADAYLLEASTNTWSRIQTDGAGPSARAAHAAACVDPSQLVVYGGSTGGGSLSTDEPYLLDIRNEARPVWTAIPVLGPSPGRRYGHTMVHNKPLLVVFGGNNGQQAKNDIWVLDVEHAPFQWTEVTVMHAKSPVPRVYHSAEVCREGPAGGMMVVFGGRTPDGGSLRDIWGLRQHRDGRWDWVEAPTKRGGPPEARVQHSCTFLGSKLVITGGRGQDVNKPLPTAVYDTETCEWKMVSTVNRFRHASWVVGNLIFAYGGFDHKSQASPTSDLQVLDLERAVSAEEASQGGGMELAKPPSPAAQAASAPVGSGVRASTPPRSRPLGGQAKAAPVRPVVPEEGIKISPQVFVAMENDAGQQVRQMPIEHLEEEGRKMAPSSVMANLAIDRSTRGDAASGVVSFVIDNLLQPRTWQPDPDPNRFILHAMEVAALCDQALEVFKQEKMLLRLRAPIKIYGDIHAQYLDLMRLFARYKGPSDGEDGDIDSMDYLFLGDFVDRGSFNLETMCLLFALKIRYPTQVHMIRGNHEDPTINAIYGLRDECRRRLHEESEDPESCWNKFNRVFEWLPIAAIIEDRMLCVHGGVGGSIDNLAQINSIQRPLHVAQIPQTPSEQRVTDLLWSDPSDSDAATGVTLNETRDPDGSGRIVKYGPDRVEDFLKNNPPLSMIVRAHECVMDGFERFANGHLITIFSATDYCGHHKNAGALLFVRRDLTVVPKLIYPVERQLSTWDPVVLQQRPPTPPRPARAARLGQDDGQSGQW